MKNHVTAALAAEHEACPFQGGPDFSSRKAGGKFGHGPKPLRLGRLDFDEFLADLSRDRIASVATVFKIKRDCLANVGKRLDAGVALADAAYQCGNARYVAAIWLLL